ncbi:glycosyl transferase [Rhodoferax lacus]|uniref:Glycosyl transferase n=1 Tax=Rhodoferax lacus TaxID=2184758 RepID=A0A3E1RGD5_9BURK|nr:glycosyltransferase family A protein [Rhodoferax lacus]RFO98301.1 glycosyl transferase [Rhodoferax lacus]
MPDAASPLAASPALLAVVAIGRNEGQRLQACLASALASGQVGAVVYVDSGSTDNSVSMALGLGCSVVNLDMAQPFTAARARNEGFARALQLLPKLRYVQFVDGDCELVDGWLAAALAFAGAHPDVAAVCGRRRERYPHNSIYNQLCDIEWDTPAGPAKSCGGDVLMRADALQAAGGYRAGLIAGEEPELCVRLRAAGWRIWRLDHEMTLHDAAILRFGQWWNRSKRAGYAFAHGAALHGAKPEQHWVRETRSAWLWGLWLPCSMLCLALLTHGWALGLFLAYPLQALRIYLRNRNKLPAAGWHAVFLVLGKFPEAQGALRSWVQRLGGKTMTLIEYK